MADEKDGKPPDTEADEADETEADETEADETEADETEDDETEDDDGDDEDGDDEDEEAPPPAKKKSAKPAKPAKAESRAADRKRKRPPPSKPVLPPEKDIAAPSRQTMIMLGVMAGATLLMWGSARFACNAHPAQTRKPRDVSTAELSRDPKDAALELQQRWNSYDFKGALELAKGPIADELQKAQSECEKDSAGCDAKKKSVEDKALATAALLSRGPGSAKVRVVSLGGAAGNQTVIYTLEQDAAQWKVSGRGADQPTPTPAPAPAPSGSAAPEPSAGH